MPRILLSEGHGSIATRAPLVLPTGLIPLSLNDSRFASNTNGTGGDTYDTGTFHNLNYKESPTYPDGNECFLWASTNSGDVLNMSQFAVDWREGPRIAADTGATFNMDQFFINCVGKTGDHADGIQAFDPGGTGIVNVTNTCFRSYDSAEAVAVYGAGFVGSDAVFWADTYSGTLKFNNVLIWGGDRGVTVFVDTGCTVHINFENVYFAPSAAGSFNGYKYDIVSTGGTLIVDKWTNVCDATVVGNTIVPGSQLPSP